MLVRATTPQRTSSSFAPWRSSHARVTCTRARAARCLDRRAAAILHRIVTKLTCHHRAENATECGLTAESTNDGVCCGGECKPPADGGCPKAPCQTTADCETCEACVDGLCDTAGAVPLNCICLRDRSDHSACSGVGCSQRRCTLLRPVLWHERKCLRPLVLHARSAWGALSACDVSCVQLPHSCC